MPIPWLTLLYHLDVIARAGAQGPERDLAVAAAMIGRECMKIYLLVMLIGSLLTAIHFTSTPKRQSETIPQ